MKQIILATLVLCAFGNALADETPSPPKVLLSCSHTHDENVSNGQFTVDTLFVYSENGQIKFSADTSRFNGCIQLSTSYRKEGILTGSSYAPTRVFSNDEVKIFPICGGIQVYNDIKSNVQMQFDPLDCPEQE